MVQILARLQLGRGHNLARCEIDYPSHVLCRQILIKGALMLAWRFNLINKDFVRLQLLLVDLVVGVAAHILLL